MRRPQGRRQLRQRLLRVPPPPALETLQSVLGTAISGPQTFPSAPTHAPGLGAGNVLCKCSIFQLIWQESRAAGRLRSHRWLRDLVLR